MSVIVPIPLCPRTPIAIRPATMGDLAFIDSLQKKHAQQVGWMPTKQLEGKIGAEHVIVAENRVSGLGCRGSGEDEPLDASYPKPDPRTPKPEPLGYCIGHDQYFKRDD